MEHVYEYWDVEKSRLYKLYYDIAADVCFVFGSGERIRCNKTLLAVHSLVFQQMFFGQLRETRDVMIRDSAPREFKMFLDCLLGFRDVELAVAWLVLPVAEKYDAAVLKAECERVLVGTGELRHVLLVLDLGIIHNSRALVDFAIASIYQEGIERLFSDSSYYAVLTPRCLETLLIHFKPNNKRFHEFLIDWGNFYLRHHRIGLTLRTFLEMHNIWDKLSTEGFSILDLIDYHQQKEVVPLYSEVERVDSFKRICSRVLDFPKTSSSKRIREGDVVREYFDLHFSVDDLDDVQWVVLLHGRQPNGKRAYRDRINCEMVIFYTDIEQKGRQMTCRSVCKRKIKTAQTIKFKFPDVVDCSLVARLDSAHITYTFHKDGVYSKALPRILNINTAQLCHTSDIALLANYSQ